MPAVDGLCECVGEERAGRGRRRLSRREQRPRAGNLEHADRERVVRRVAFEQGLGLGPATQRRESLGCQRVQVAAEAVVQPGEVAFGDGVERGVDGLSIPAASSRTVQRYSVASARVWAFGASANDSRQSSTPSSGSPSWLRRTPSTRRAITHAGRSSVRGRDEIEDLWHERSASA